MAQVKYHGEFPEGAESISQYGYEFEGNKAVNVTDEAHLAKFASNRFFEVSGESDKEQVDQGKADAEKAEEETLRAWLAEHQVPVHHRAGLKALREAKDGWLKAQEKAQAE